MPKETTPTEPEVKPTETPDIADAARESDSIAAMLGVTRKKKDKAPKEPAETPKDPAVAAPEPPGETPKEPKASEPPVAPETPAAAPEGSATAMPTAPERPALKVKKPKKSLSPEEIAEIAAQAAARVAPPQSTKQPDTPAFELPPELKPMEDVYSELEKINPQKYAGIARKQAEFMQKEVAYAEQWERENPGRQYDPDDPEHAGFYKRHQPDIDPRDLHRAEIRAEARGLLKAEVEPKVQEYEKAVKLMRAEPEADRMAHQFSVQVFSELAPDAKDNESFAEWAKKNPIQAESAYEIVTASLPIARAASLLWDDAVKFNPIDPSHVRAVQLFNEMERRLIQRDEPLEDAEGRTWLPLHRYNALPPEKRARHFTTSKRDVIEFISRCAAEIAKNVAQERLQYAERFAPMLGYVKPTATNLPQHQQQPAPSKPVPVLNSPSVSTGGPTTPTAGTAPAPQPERRSAIAAALGLR